MKSIFGILILITCFFVESRSQTNISNDYTLVIPKCENKPMILTRFRIDGMPNHKVNKFRDATKFQRGMTIERNKTFFDSRVMAKWNDKRFKLVSIEVINEEYQESSEYCPVYIHFRMAKIQK